MNIIDKILSRQEFIIDPPILIDIGASGNLHKEWIPIAKYSICIAFDADERKMGYIVKEDSKYKKLYIYNCIVSDKIKGKNNFYLTNSPYCSSLLKPDSKSLQNWGFHDLFNVKKKIKLNSIPLPTVLEEQNIKRVDWFKTDSQGTDLRLFESLGENTINKILVTDFEPGIIDAYKSEDKLHNILAYMDCFPFFVSNMKVEGAIRMNDKIISAKFNGAWKKILNLVSRKSPCWTEISYLNTFKNVNTFNKRDFLLGWVFSLIKKQLCFALELATKGKKKFDDPIFIELENYTLRKIKSQLNYFPLFFVKIIIGKLFSEIA
ncbi:MAG: FkbM family methyltransferase [bacterium]